jgi:hypothetical protein
MNVDAGYVASTNGSGASDHGGAAVAGGGLGGSLKLVRRRPEVLVGVAFAGGVIAAFLLRRLGR